MLRNDILMHVSLVEIRYWGLFRPSKELKIFRVHCAVAVDTMASMLKRIVAELIKRFNKRKKGCKHKMKNGLLHSKIEKRELNKKCFAKTILK